MTTRRGPLVALLAVASFAAPDAASATVRAVDKSGADNATCSVATPWETIGQAVSVAGADDIIDIGPGSYDEAVVADQRLHFRGAGPGSPDSLITAGTTRIQPLVDDGPALELRAGGSAHDRQLVGKANRPTGPGCCSPPRPPAARWRSTSSASTRSGARPAPARARRASASTTRAPPASSTRASAP